mgnify:FL=1|tara:strand:- start:186 stop:557 length:372 start_codon:yes stop_codon:yes gene_type:complete
MAYSETVKFVTGDSLPEVTVNLKDSNTAASGKVLDENDNTTWAPINLTGASVKMRIREVGSDTITKTLTMTITDAANGKAATDFPSTFTTPGVFEGEVEITFSTGGIQTIYDLIKFNVRGDFD